MNARGTSSIIYGESWYSLTPTKDELWIERCGFQERRAQPSGGRSLPRRKLNLTMSEPFGENGSGAAVDVVVPDDAGHTEELETE